MPPNLIVRLYYGDRDHLNRLAEKYDVFEYANHDEGYVDARLRPNEYEELTQAGYWIEIDEEQTALANRPLAKQPNQSSAIPSFPCYRTVEETFATLAQITTNYPSLASLLDIGDSWEKVTPDGATGYDMLVLLLSNKSRPGPKPKFFLMAEHHARELTTAETALRFAEELVAGYGIDPEVTWILDYNEIHILPMANPDGRKWAEQGQYWRKNTDNNDGCATFPSYGTDLNRNFSYQFGLANGSSSSPCDGTYSGPAAFSEPENQAIRDYVLSLFPDQRGPTHTDVAPTNTTGLVFSLHSYARLVLYSWGWTNTPPPNAAGLQTLGGKFGYFNRYQVGSSSTTLNVLNGSLNDWVYGELGVPSYTVELGTAFFESCANFQNTIYPSNRPALFYAAKACRQPYLSPLGPDVLQAAVSKATNVAGSTFVLNATAISGRAFGYSPLPAATAINSARYSVDNPSWINGVVTHAMTATDGSFNSANEMITATVDTTGWSAGRHSVFIEAKTGNNNWGVPVAVFVWIESPTAITTSLQSNQIILQWPSVTNKLYTLLQTSDLSLPFSVLASNLTARPPSNTYTNAISTIGPRFYRLRIEP